MSCEQFLQFIRKKCSECFRLETPQHKPLQQKIIKNSQYKKMEESYEMKPFKSHNNATNQSNKFLVKQDEPINEDQFYSIEETGHTQSLNNIKSNKKKNLQLPKLIKKSLTYTQTNQKEKQQSYNSAQWEDTPVLQQRFCLSESLENIKDWLKKQYGKSKIVSLRVNHAIRLRMQGQGMLTMLSHKLQDFKIKCSKENNAYLNPLFKNKSKTLSLRFQKQEIGQVGYKQTKFFSNYQINTYSTALEPLLKALLSKEAMKIMNCFKDIQIVQNQGEILRISFPILKVKQASPNSKSQKIFHLGTQIYEFNDAISQQKQIILISYSLDQCQQNWQCLIKISFGFITRIQIYSESYEYQKLEELPYFQQKFNQLQKYLFNLKLIPAN